MRFETFVPCRLGEPITAVELDHGSLFFGSISGYIGRYDFVSRTTSYSPICHSELIRSICLHDDQLYVCVGDDFIAKYEADDLSTFTTIGYNAYKHKDLLCGNNFTFVKYSMHAKSVVAFLALFPTSDVERWSKINSVRECKRKQTNNSHQAAYAGG